MVTTSKKTLKYNRIAKQAGMTLIELTVVLLVLVGLAGLVVPYVGGFNEKTHDSVNSGNLSGLNDAFGRYVNEKGRLPPHLDLLVNSADAAADAGTGACKLAQTKGDPYCGLSNANVFAAATKQYIGATGSDAIARESLATSGINMVVANNPLAVSKTFDTSTSMIYLKDKDYYDGSVKPMDFSAAYFLQVGAADAGSVEKHLAKALGRDPMVYNTTCYDYVVMGIGDNSELIQTTSTNAPVVLVNDPDYAPSARYAHYMAVIQVDKDNSSTPMMGAPCSTVTEKAKFLGVVANVPASESGSLVGVRTQLNTAYANKAAGG